ncbi:MAG: hypothetical protein HOO95_05905 [Gallionella sp.]|nr:hypothetical protein [Gallionella sp.]
MMVMLVGSATLVYVTNMRWEMKWILLVLMLSNFAYCLPSLVWLRHSHSWREITLNRRDIAVGMGDGSTLTGQLVDCGMVFSHFVILLVRFDGYRFNTARVIFRDALPSEAFRELCVYLKYPR